MYGDHHDVEIDADDLQDWRDDMIERDDCSVEPEEFDNGFGEGEEDDLFDEVERYGDEGDGRGDDWKYAEFETPEFDG